MIVWSKAFCPKCVSAKKLLDIRGIEYEERIIGKDWAKEDLLRDIPSARSVPQIINKGTLIGGLPELMKYLENTANVKNF